MMYNCYVIRGEEGRFLFFKEAEVRSICQVGFVQYSFKMSAVFF